MGKLFTYHNSDYGCTRDSWVKFVTVICPHTFSLCGGDSGSSALSSSV